jgi:hypothetical protein
MLVTILAASVLNVTAALAPAPAKAVEVRFETVKVFSSMCHRQTTEVTVKEPSNLNARLGIPTPAVGLVSFKTQLNPGTICLQAFGPHTGGIDLPLGSSLPALHNGYYALDIDGANYGVLDVGGDDGVKLIDWSELPQ